VTKIPNHYKEDGSPYVDVMDCHWVVIQPKSEEPPMRRTRTPLECRNQCVRRMGLYVVGLFFKKGRVGKGLFTGSVRVLR
jgi:hypothetical protein